MFKKNDKMFVNIQLPKEMLERIDNYRRNKERIPSRAATITIRELIDKALGSPKKVASKKKGS